MGIGWGLGLPSAFGRDVKRARLRSAEQCLQARIVGATPELAVRVGIISQWHARLRRHIPTGGAPAPGSDAHASSPLIHDVGVGHRGLNARVSELARMPLAGENNEAFHPLQIGFLDATAVMANAHGFAQRIEQP